MSTSATTSSDLSSFSSYRGGGGDDGNSNNHQSMPFRTPPPSSFRNSGTGAHHHPYYNGIISFSYNNNNNATATKPNNMNIKNNKNKNTLPPQPSSSENNNSSISSSSSSSSSNITTTKKFTSPIRVKTPTHHNHKSNFNFNTTTTTTTTTTSSSSRSRNNGTTTGQSSSSSAKSSYGNSITNNNNNNIPVVCRLGPAWNHTSNISSMSSNMMNPNNDYISSSNNGFGGEDNNNVVVIMGDGPWEESLGLAVRTLQDERAVWANVAKACHTILFTCGISCWKWLYSTTSSSSRYTNKSYMIMDQIIPALATTACGCSSNSSILDMHHHFVVNDRRCRILACRTLSLLPKSISNDDHNDETSTTISPLYSNENDENDDPETYYNNDGNYNDGHNCKDDIIPILLSVAQDDEDDGVSSIAFECCANVLGYNNNYNHNNSGSVDVPGPYSPYVWKDWKQEGWKERILLNTVVPKLYRLLLRVSLYLQPNKHVLSTLDFFTHSFQQCSSTISNSNRNIRTNYNYNNNNAKLEYAKRGYSYQKNISSLLEFYIQHILTPLLHDNNNKNHSTISTIVLSHLLKLPTIQPNKSHLRSILFSTLSSTPLYSSIQETNPSFTNNNDNENDNDNDNDNNNYISTSSCNLDGNIDTIILTLYYLPMIERQFYLSKLLIELSKNYNFLDIRQNHFRLTAGFRFTTTTTASTNKKEYCIYPKRIGYIMDIATLIFFPDIHSSHSILQQLHLPSSLLLSNQGRNTSSTKREEKGTTTTTTQHNNNSVGDWIMCLCTVCYHLGQLYTRNNNSPNSFSLISWQQTALELIIQLIPFLSTSSTTATRSSQLYDGQAQEQEKMCLYHGPFIQLFALLLHSFDCPCHLYQHIHTPIRPNNNNTQNNRSLNDHMSPKNTYPHHQQSSPSAYNNAPVATLMANNSISSTTDNTKTSSELYNLVNILVEKTLPSIPLVEFKNNHNSHNNWMMTKMTRSQLLSLITDYWVHKSTSTIPSLVTSTNTHDDNTNMDEKNNYSASKNDEGPIDTDDFIIPNFHQAREILSLLGEDLSYLLSNTGKNEFNFVHVMNIIAQIETIAIVAIIYKRNNNINSSFKANDGEEIKLDDFEDGECVINLAKSILQGQGKPLIAKNNDMPSNHDNEDYNTIALMKREVLEAVARLQSLSSSNQIQTQARFTSNNGQKIMPLQSLLIADPLRIPQLLSTSIKKSDEIAVWNTQILLLATISLNTNIQFGQSNCNTFSTVTNTSIITQSFNSDLLSPRRGEITEHDYVNDSLFTCPPLFNVDTDEYKHAYLHQLCRQVILLRMEKSILKSPLISLLHDSAMMTHPTGTSTPTAKATVPKSSSRTNSNMNNQKNIENENDKTSNDNANFTSDTLMNIKPKNVDFSIWPPISKARTSSQSFLQNHHGSCFSHWRNSITTVTSPSDPVQIIVSYGLKQYQDHHHRHKEIQFRLTVKIQMYNITAVSIPKGVRLDLSVVPSNDMDVHNDSNVHWDSISKHLFGNQQSQGYLSQENNKVTSKTALYKQAIKAGEQIVWEIEFDSWSWGNSSLCVSVTFRDLETEPLGYQIAQIPENDSEISHQDNNNIEEKDIDDVGSVTLESSSSAVRAINEQFFMNEDETSDVTLTGEPVPVTPLIMLHPCPLVFYRDCCGDENAFRFLWIHMSCCLPIFSLTNPEIIDEHTPIPTNGEAAKLLAHVSKLMICAVDSENIQYRAWAFQTWCGKRLLCVLTPSLMENKKRNGSSFFLHVRSDDERIIRNLFGLKTMRTRFICDLMGGIERGCWNLQLLSDSSTYTLF